MIDVGVRPTANAKVPFALTPLFFLSAVIALAEGLLPSVMILELPMLEHD